MLDLRFVRENLDAVAEALRKRGSDLDLGPFRALDAARRERLVEIESLKKLRNDASKEIGKILKSGGDASALRQPSGEEWGRCRRPTPPERSPRHGAV